MTFFKQIYDQKHTHIMWMEKSHRRHSASKTRHLTFGPRGFLTLPQILLS